VQSTTPASRTEPTSAAAAAASSQPSSAVPTSATTETKPSAATAGSQDGTSSQQSSTTEKQETTNGGAPKMQFSDFQNILGNLAASGGGRSDLDLSDVLTLDVMAPILSNKDVQARLIEHLPESPDILAKNEHELRQTITTPQFKKALSSFCMALQSGQLGPVFKQFDLPDEVSNAAAQGNLEAFAKAMEAHAKKAKKANDDDAMDTK
jgi:26S proteasome regulatory subunit N13